MIYKLINAPRTGKGVVMTAMNLMFVTSGLDGRKYKASELYVNYDLLIDGAGYEGVHFLRTRADVLKFLKQMIDKEMSHICVSIADCDQVLPPRWWQNKKQTEALMAVWQEAKLMNTIMYDCHWGDVDKMLRDNTDWVIIPEIDTFHDRLNAGIFSMKDRQSGHVFEMVPRPSSVYRYFHSFNPTH